MPSTQTLYCMLACALCFQHRVWYYLYNDHMTRDNGTAYRNGRTDRLCHVLWKTISCCSYAVLRHATNIVPPRSTSHRVRESMYYTSSTRDFKHTRCCCCDCVCYQLPYHQQCAYEKCLCMILMISRRVHMIPQYIPGHPATTFAMAFLGCEAVARKCAAGLFVYINRRVSMYIEERVRYVVAIQSLEYRRSLDRYVRHSGCVIIKNTDTECTE